MDCVGLLCGWVGGRCVGFGVWLSVELRFVNVVSSRLNVAFDAYFVLTLTVSIVVVVSRAKEPSVCWFGVSGSWPGACCIGRLGRVHDADSVEVTVDDDYAPEL